MASAKQVAANRENAKKSTGPKSDAGKAVSSQNARRHGLFGRDVAHENEDPEAFDSLVSELRAELSPGSVLEEQLIDQLAMAFWRNRRLAIAERDQLNDVPSYTSKPAGFMGLNNRILYGRYQTMITNETRKTLAMFYEVRERRVNSLEVIADNDCGADRG